jgi:hypothetical protein
VSLGAALFIFGLISFWLQGSEQAAISAKIAHIEERLNGLVSEPRLLSWETDHQKRSFFNKWVLGLRLPANARTEKTEVKGAT